MTRLDVSQIDQEPRHLNGLGPRIYRHAGRVGLAGLAISLVLSWVLPDGRRQFWNAYLLNHLYFLSLSLGALFFVVLQHLTRSGWSVVVRRLAEIVSANLIVLAVLLIPILFSTSVLYPWRLSGNDALLAGKRAYLNPAFFVARCLLYAAVWAWLSWYFLRRSVEQDESADPALTLRMARVGGPAIVLFALTITFAAFDLIMSLQPRWYSTIFGVYFFSSSAVGCLALLPLLAMGVQRMGLLTRAITVEHYHDLGKLLFAFIFFWGYIAFSQYMLIWYGNIPEETAWYLPRQTGPWLWWSLLLLFGHFIVPFTALLSRRTKRRKGALAFWAIWMMVMHWVDICYLAGPQASPDRIPLNVMQLGCFIGLGGLFVAGLAWAAGDRSLLAIGDPRLAESLAFETT